MMMLKETLYKGSEKPVIIEKPFGSKNEIIKILKNQSPLPGKVIYELSKYNESYYEAFGMKHKLNIYNPATKDRE